MERRTSGARWLCKSFASALASAAMLLGASAHAQSLAITVSPNVPRDIPGGAPQASLAAAAAFAWQEFIALNWPARAGQRDVPDFNRPFGASGGPLVWQTYRSKVEIFPGNGNANVGPPGYSPAGGPSYGYNTTPIYNYAIPVPACPGQAPVSQPAWVNLDEITQIGLNQMFAGISSTAPSNRNSQPQLVRFLAKANQTQYSYVAANQYWYTNAALRQAAQNFVNGIKQVPPRFAAGRVAFPSGTIEVKSAWRKLAPTEDPSRFHRQTVRFYERKGTNNGLCYFEEQWAMVALHIIHKTPSAPNFIYATFEQSDNILLADGSRVEDQNGVILRRPPVSSPTTPALSYQDSPSNPQVRANGPFCQPARQLYYQETPGSGKPVGGSICVNQRYESITAEVIQANRDAHQAIQAYTLGRGIGSSPWQYYKLVSVQAQPFDVSQISRSDVSHGPAVFYQANIMVETDYTLQQFKGRIAANGAPTSFQAAGAPPPPNVYSLTNRPPVAQGVNMGGCMGCHGNAQVAGYDFSFILKGGQVRLPEAPGGNALAEASARYQEVFNPHIEGDSHGAQ
ncbi:hypothetical protein [Pseudomonas sp. CMR5c]|uniref:hypothetical protein n=1 Tax=Pseudomonas sp. CMR5c TaxID=658630 RepID=UPI00069ECFA8|nr:hypothetical protein [Pseudomonas sp. CMR5c]AZC18922.1 Cytochrome c family protein [Pseudomonas sp. CMR5c]